MLEGSKRFDSSLDNTIQITEQKRMIKMRTTNSDFKELVRNHIKERLNYEEANNVKDGLQNVVDAFNDWYSTPNQKRMTPNHQEAFTYFLQCLHSCIDIEHGHFEIYDTLRDWFVVTVGVYRESANDKEASLYYHLIYREFKSLCKIYDIKF